jgi:aldose 1-epimerase
MGRQRDIDVVLGYVSAEDYDLDPFYLGSTVGPVANRIADGKVTLVSGTFSISINEPSRSKALHGGELGLHQQIFQPSPTSASDSLTLSRQLPHLSDGFPGNRLVTVHYELVDATSLQCDFAATTDRETVINVANHAYFNLGGPLADHEFRAHCEHFTPFDEQLIPIGTITSLSGSELDFRQWHRLGDSVLDHNFVLRANNKLQKAASLRLRDTQLQLDVLTTQPALQVYTGDGLTAPFSARAGICLEAQAFPDAPNQSNFPSIVLTPGRTYRQRTIYRFGELSDH